MQRDMLLLPFMDEPGAKVDTSDIGGPIQSRPRQYEDQLFKEQWVARIPLHGSTFKQLLLQQPRFSVSGNGPMLWRTVSADTRPAAELLDGRARERTVDFLRGLQRTLDERGANVEGFSFARDGEGYSANAMAAYVEAGVFDRYARDLREQRLLMKVLLEHFDMSRDTYAWYTSKHHEIALGPEVSRPLLQSLRAPRSVPAKRQLFAAYVLRHEIEHAVSASDVHFDRDEFHLDWLEEGTADTLARWPGQAAATARAMGLRVPPKADGKSIDQIYGADVSGYRVWVDVTRGVLQLAGIDPARPGQFDHATTLLQGQGLGETPEAIAEAIVEHHGIRPETLAAITASVESLDGRPARLKALRAQVKRLDHRPRASR